MKKWVALVVAILSLMGPVSAGAQAISQAQLSELASPLAGLLAAKMDGGMAYPQAGEEIQNDYALAYLFYMANIFYTEAGAPLANGGRFDAGASISQDEAALMLSWAFGDLFTTEDLKPDGEMVAEAEGGYVIGLSDGYPLTVTYAGDAGDAEWTEGARYPYDYALATGDGGARTGELEASVDYLREDEDALCVTGLYVSDSQAQPLGNWYAPDGRWFSLMAESLVFCFDEKDNLSGQGTYQIFADHIALALDSGEISGTIEEARITLKGEKGGVYEKK
ncbi:MAG: hypothetical protein RR296_02385 [Clostridia bacterium]